MVSMLKNGIVNVFYQFVVVDENGMQANCHEPNNNIQMNTMELSRTKTSADFNIGGGHATALLTQSAYLVSD